MSGYILTLDSAFRRLLDTLNANTMISWLKNLVSNVTPGSEITEYTLSCILSPLLDTRMFSVLWSY